MIDDDLELDDDTEDQYQGYVPTVVQPRAALPTAAPVSATRPLPGYQPHQFSAPVQGAQPFFISGAAPAQSTEQRSVVKDFARQAWISAVQTGNDLLGAASAADRALTGNPDTVAWIEQQRRNLGDYAASQLDKLSPQAKKAFQSSLFGGENALSPSDVGWGNYLGATVASFIPSALLAVLPGGIVGRVLTKALGSVAGSVAGVATTGGLFGAQQAGGSYEALVDEIDRAKVDELMQSPVYVDARQQGASDVDARRMLVQHIAPTMAALQFGIGAAAGAGTGQLITRGALGAAGTSLGRRSAIGAAEGAATLGGQAGGGNIVQQSANVQAGVQKEFDPAETARAFAGGALGGAALGAVGGALHRGAQRAKPEPEPVVPDDHKAAMAEALGQLPAPTERPMLTFNPDRTQGAGIPPVSTGEGFIPGQPGFTTRPSETVPEPVEDIRAQVAALADPQNPRDAVFVAKGTTLPPGIPKGVTRVIRPEGALLTNNPAKAALFRRSKVINDTVMAHLLGYPETKAEAIASGEPRVVQGKDERGNVVAESVVSPQNEGVARAQAAEQVPGGSVETVTPEASIARRQEKITPVPTHPVDEAAAQAAEPTPAQAEAGNYQKGHIGLQGLDISIETPKGAVRRGPIDEATGKPAYENEMPAHYGYIRGTTGGDGQHIDVQLGPRTAAMFDGKPADAAREPVYIVDQIDPKTGKFDEHKAFLGFHTAVEAARAYDASFSDGSGPARRGAVSEMTFGGFKDWLKSGKTDRAVAYKPTRSDILKKREAEKRRLAGEKPAQTRGYVAPETEAPSGTEAPSKTTTPVVGLVKREPRMVREARAEAEHQPQVAERQKPTTVVEEPAEKPRSAQTTNKDRLLSDLESKVANGLMTAAEADRAYGRQALGAGRRRTFRDFASWIRDRLSKIEDGKAEKALLERAREIEADRSIPYAKRLAQSREINKQLAKVGPEYIEKLRTMLRELEDPVGAALEGKGRPKLHGQGARVDAYYDQRINKPVQDVLDQAHETKTGASIHKFLDAIVNDKIINVRLPQAVALARILKQRLPENLQVFTQEVAATRLDMPGLILPDKLGMFYWKQPGLDEPMIVLSRFHTGSSLVETVLHEATHAVTTDYIRSLKPGSVDHKALSTIAVELYENIGSRDYLTEDERSALAYAVSDPYELHTMLMTNPTVQRLAAEVRPSATFIERMRALGYDLSPAKTVWQAFTQWVRKVIGLPANSDSLLDHVLRPLQDITDRATEFNRITDPATMVREAAAHALPRFNRETAERAISAADFKGLGDRGRRVVLTGATTDGIVDWNRDLFKSRDPEAPGNSLEDYRTATEAQAARSARFREKYSDRLMNLVNKARGEEYDAIGQLMNDATIAEAHLGSNAKNDHLTTSEQKKALADLQARYNQLSDGAKQVYNGLRDYYRETYEAERTAQLASMIKMAIPEAKLDQVKALAVATRTKAGIQKLIDNPDKSPVAAAFADAWDRSRALVREIAKVHNKGFTRGDHFPLRRYGDYVIHYGTKGTDDYGVERFERRSQAEARRDELVRQGAEPSQVLDLRRSNLRAAIPTTVMDELDAAIRRHIGGSEADAVKDMFASILLQHASRSEAARFRLRRQGVKGAANDLGRVAAQDMLSTAARMGYLEHGPERAQALAAMRRHADYLGRNGAEGEQIRAQAVLNELEKRQPAGDDASGSLTGLTRKFSTLGFVYSLMSPSHMLTNTIEAHMNSSALLGARHGYARAGLALTKALRDVTPTMAQYGVRNTLKSVGAGLKSSDWHLGHVVRDRLIAGGADRAAMTDLFKRMEDAGLIDHSMVREMQRMSRPNRDVTLGWWDKFLDLNTAGAHAVDVANKTAIAKAAYDLELRRTGSHDQAANYAVETARKVMPNYNVHNKARISTAQGPLGGFAGPLTQFKQYGIHMYSVLSNQFRASLHGASRAERLEARKAFAGLLATHALMAGSLTLIADPLRYIGGAYDFITDTKPHDYQNDVRRWIADAFGPELGEIISRGLPHAVGIDLHRRIGLANMLEIPELKSFDKAGVVDMIAEAMTGASGQDAAAMVGALNKLRMGDLEGGLKDLVPRVLRDPMKAIGLADKGVTDSHGRTILPADKLSTFDIAAQAAGFQPSRVSEFREGRYAILEARKEEQAARSTALNAFITSTGGNRRDALNKVRDYNREHPDSPITYSQLIQGLKRQQQQVQNPSTFGLQLPKRSAPRLSEFGGFVNSQ